MAIVKGSKVRKVIPDIVGTVIEARTTEDATFEYLVEYADANGEVQRRSFPISELVEEPEGS